MKQSLIIAIDFDGTIVEHAYPKIGREQLFAFQTLKAIAAEGHRLVLWTIREGDLLQEAVEYCKKNGLEFYAINESFPGEGFRAGQSRKVNADLFIDDRLVLGFPGWSTIWEELTKKGIVSGDAPKATKKKKGLFW